MARGKPMRPVSPISKTVTPCRLFMTANASRKCRSSTWVCPACPDAAAQDSAKVQMAVNHASHKHRGRQLCRHCGAVRRPYAGAPHDTTNTYQYCDEAFDSAAWKNPTDTVEARPCQTHARPHETEWLRRQEHANDSKCVIRRVA